jgi:hypothetical protein
MKLLQHVIFHLTTQGKEKSENLELASNLTSKVLEFAKIGQKKEEIALNKQKFQWDAAGACLALLPELKAISSDKALNEAEKVEQIRLKLFGVIP